MKENRNPLLDLRDSAAASSAAEPITDNAAYAEGTVTEEEKRRVRKAALIKLLAMLIFVICCIIFGSIAWFTMNKDVSGSGMGAKISSDTYQIVPVDGIDSIFQGYYDYIDNYNSDALVWKMNDESNMENYTDDVGISPGSFGTISFYVKPNDDSINLDLSFSIVGYEYKEQIVTTAAAEGGNAITTTTTIQENAEEPAETTTQQTIKTMTAVTPELQNYLAGHILLFQNRTDTYDKPVGDPDRKIISSVYSDPILSGADLNKVIRNRTFTKANQNTPVNIYWVWPKTLSTLVDATENANVSITPFSNGTDYTTIVNHIISNPTYYFYQYNGAETTLTENLMSDEYDTYGDYYDRVDNEIGLKVSYITLKMTSNEAASSTATTTSASTTTTTEAE